MGPPAVHEAGRDRRASGVPATSHGGAMTDSAASPAALVVNDLSAGYAGATILEGVEFEVPAGQVLAILGRNGAGKTTLLRCLSGLIPSRTGSITLQGQ